MSTHWENLAEQYYNDLRLRRRAEATICIYKLHLRRFVAMLRGILPEQVSGPKMHTAYTRTLESHPNSYKGYGSIRLLESIVKAFLRWCIISGQTPTFSLPIQTGGYKKSCTRTTAIRQDETDRLLAAIQGSNSLNRNRDAALFAIYAFTGIRRSEALSITYSDFNTTSNELRIKGKGGSYRLKPVINILNAILGPYHKTFAGQQTTANGSTPYIFTGNDPDRPLSARQVNNLFSKWKSRAGIRNQLTVHSFRAGFATTLYNESKDILLVSNALGHRALETTMTYIDISSRLPNILNLAFSKERIRDRAEWR